MRDINKVILIGRLGGDPEARKTSDGRIFAYFSLATSKKKKVKNDEPKNEIPETAAEGWINDTQWHKVVCWGPLAQICLDYFKKGYASYVEGHLRSYSVETEKGEKKYFYEVVAENLSLLEKKAHTQEAEALVL